jgi:hypothetical protein
MKRSILAARKVAPAEARRRSAYFSIVKENSGFIEMLYEIISLFQDEEIES